MEDLESQLAAQDAQIRIQTERAMRLVEESRAATVEPEPELEPEPSASNSELVTKEQETKPRVTGAPKRTTRKPTAQETQYQRRVQALAAQLATQEAGGDEIVAQLGQEAELVYLRTRVDTLTDLINQLNRDMVDTQKREKDAREEMATLKVERDQLAKTVRSTMTSNEKLSAQVDTLQQQLHEAQAAKVELKDEISKAERVAKIGLSTVSSKDRDLARMIETTEKLKGQLRESVAREGALRDELDSFKKTQLGEARSLQREKDELLLIVKKQQQLIDVLQRQKLHLQGAIHLGLSEEQFNRLLEAQ
ncbi:hypothetical protein GMRT_10019 [Giardia muris]|uniref:Uncharacterized protein n=1 Tax=Giardia muris TaxID=5742 RepID=A0A4Z1SQD6_GIAMU|nr:hypothetical protein GMRT_10019 [Giardia muris]|eukprot:TNJ28064.1 hypothetical protein GMRT_10019 [Giardia muris]